MYVQFNFKERRKTAKARKPKESGGVTGENDLIL